MAKLHQWDQQHSSDTPDSILQMSEWGSVRQLFEIGREGRIGIEEAGTKVLWGLKGLGGAVVSSVWGGLSSSSNSSSDSSRGQISVVGGGSGLHHHHHSGEDPMSDAGVSHFVHGLLVIGGEWVVVVCLRAKGVEELPQYP